MALSEDMRNGEPALPQQHIGHRDQTAWLGMQDSNSEMSPQITL
jgi:hypothetical protein